nr:hypothetical protein [uncultured archaeon]
MERGENSAELLKTVRELLSQAEKLVNEKPLKTQANIIKSHTMLKSSPAPWQVNSNWQNARQIYLEKIALLVPKLKENLHPAELFFHDNHHHDVV